MGHDVRLLELVDSVLDMLLDSVESLPGQSSSSSSNISETPPPQDSFGIDLDYIAPQLWSETLNLSFPSMPEVA